MTSSLVPLTAGIPVPELHEHHQFMPPWGYGLFALALFGLMYLVLLAFRNTAARYGAPKGQTGSKH